MRLFDRLLAEFRAAIRARLGPSGLSADASKSIFEQMNVRYPRWPLAMLIPINADAMAKELESPTTP